MKAIFSELQLHILLLTKQSLTRAKKHRNNSNGDGNNDLFHNKYFLFDIYVRNSFTRIFKI
jgi:hypothetical protein